MLFRNLEAEQARKGLTNSNVAEKLGISRVSYESKNGGAGGVTNPFAKDTFNLTEQGRMLKENPAQAKELAAAAGVTL